MNNPAQAKQHMREQLFSARNSLEDATRASMNRRITQNLLQLFSTVAPRSIAAYAPESNEPGGADMLDALLALSPWLPICYPQRQLRWAQIHSHDDLHIGSYGLFEPNPNLPHEPSAVLAELDCIIVPALGATPQGVRIGRGAGFYDRALEGIHTPTVTVLYDDEVRPDIPHAAHDAVAHWIVTDKRIISCRE